MSDLADREQESTAAVSGAGGRFVCHPHNGGYVTPRDRRLPDCGCGGRPVYKAHPPLRGCQTVEALACGTCGNSVGPFSSRSTLGMAWRLGGAERGKREEVTGNGSESREVLVPEVVVRLMPWKCADCGNKWDDRADCKGVQKRGCPKCGSGRIFDCNLAPLTNAQLSTLNAQLSTGVKCIR
jgi:DNA-directed RNA polymerase subunit RPC12/RpoP